MSQNEYNSLSAWKGDEAAEISSARLAFVFAEQLRKLMARASESLNAFTLMAILKNVVEQSAEKYPVLTKIAVETNGISPVQFESQFSGLDTRELTLAFQHLLDELFSVLGELTGNILPAALYSEKELVDETRRQLSSERLEHLFDISKIFAGFLSKEETLPEVFTIMARSIPFQSIILVSKQDCDCVTNIWHNENITEAQIKRAFDYSRKQYEDLVSPLTAYEKESLPTNPRQILPVCSLYNDYGAQFETKFITIPLTLSSLQSFGVLQIECLAKLEEVDLKFMTAIANLLAITLDRYNKEQEAEKKRRIEFVERTKELIQIHKYVKDLEQERELREQFVSILTHDLRTPLTAAKMAAQVILKKPERIEKNGVLAEKIIASVNRMDKMIKDLLDANRIRAGESLSLTMDECDLKNISMETLRDLSATFGDRFIFQSERGPITGYWNEEGLRRVLENLLNNAVKYGGSIQPILLSLKPHGQNIDITVHNFGNPIPPEEQTDLFQPFHRTSTAQNDKKGWGLGLTLVRGVAEAHGGSVRVHSNEREGTSFIVTIPRDAKPFQKLPS